MRHTRRGLAAAALLVAALAAGGAVARLAHDDDSPWPAAEHAALTGAYLNGVGHGMMWVTHQQQRVMAARSTYLAHGVGSVRLPWLIKKLWTGQHFGPDRDSVCAVLDYRPDEFSDKAQSSAFSLGVPAAQAKAAAGKSKYWFRQRADRSWEWALTRSASSWTPAGECTLRSVKSGDERDAVPAARLACEVAARLDDNSRRWLGQGANPHGVPQAVRGVVVPRRGLHGSGRDRARATHVAAAAGQPPLFFRRHIVSGEWQWATRSGDPPPPRGIATLEPAKPAEAPPAPEWKAASSAAGAPAGYAEILAALAAAPRAEDVPASPSLDRVWCGTLEEDAKKGGSKKNAFVFQDDVPFSAAAPSPFMRDDRVAGVRRSVKAGFEDLLVRRRGADGKVRVLGATVGHKGVTLEAPGAGWAAALDEALRGKGVELGSAVLSVGPAGGEHGTSDAVLAHHPATGRVALAVWTDGGAGARVVHASAAGAVPDGGAVRLASVDDGVADAVVLIGADGAPVAAGRAQAGEGGPAGFAALEFEAKWPKHKRKGTGTPARFAGLAPRGHGKRLDYEEAVFFPNTKRGEYEVWRAKEKGSYRWEYTQKWLDPLADPDRDGIPTAFELGFRRGLPLQRYGASPFARDVFLQVDWMKEGWKEYNFDQKAYRLATASLAERGINLHVFKGGTVEFERCLGTKKKKLTRKRLLGMRNKKMSVARRGVFVWGLHAYQYNCPSTSAGNALTIPSDVFVTTLPMWGKRKAADPVVQAGLLLHELGHALGLRHGGVDNVNKKPNYVSVMSYDYTKGYKVNGVKKLLYSELVCHDLDEAAVDERLGVQCRLPSAGGRKYEFHLAKYQNHAYDRGWRKVNAPVDFSGDGKVTKMAAGKWLDLNDDNFRKSKLRGGGNDYKKLKLNAKGYYLARRGKLDDSARAADAVGEAGADTVEAAVEEVASERAAGEPLRYEDEPTREQMDALPKELQETDPNTIPLPWHVVPTDDGGALQVLPPSWASAARRSLLTDEEARNDDIGVHDEADLVDAEELYAAVELRMPSSPGTAERPYGEFPMRTLGYDRLIDFLPGDMLAKIFPKLRYDNVHAPRVDQIA